MYSSERKLTLLLLCWLFGLLGTHRFYSGKYVTGALQLALLLFGAGVAYFALDVLRPVATIAFFALLFWLLVDALRIIMGNFKDREGQQVTQWV